MSYFTPLARWWAVRRERRRILREQLEFLSLPVEIQRDVIRRVAE